ncbi:MAG: hypothetical protein KAH44_05785 [Oricola sp.]|nr:hypothetical protein [Oricola sp.]
MALALIVWALVIGAAILFTGLFGAASSEEASAPAASAALSVEAAR